MTELLTSAQMRAKETAAIASGRVTGRCLMERAARGVLARLFAARPGLAAAPGRALVLCGPGNNGGDGYVLARLLHDRGWQVDVLALAAPGAGAPDAAANRALWDARGATGALDSGAVREVLDSHPPALVIDAVFGTGLQRPLAADLADALSIVARQGEAVRVAVDAPSGLCMDSGRAMVEGMEGVPLPADLTVSFHGPKPGHYLARGPAACGSLAIVDIGLDDVPQPGAATLAEPAHHALAKHADAHKYAHGHALVLGGGVARGGAARLAARAALRVGAGLVTLACPPAALIENAARLDAVMLRRLDDADALHDMLADPRINALCLGPGLGLGAATRDLCAAALASGRPLVLDADALSVFADDADALFAMLRDDVVLTPHDGEFARLFPDLAARLDAPAERGPAFSRIDAARAAAARSGAVVLLKGPASVIAAPDGAAAVNAAVHDRAAPWLATAGAGDVLSGLIAGLLARRMAAPVAAQTAAWLHVAAARAFGPGLIAEDLPDLLPGVMRELGL